MYASVNLIIISSGYGLSPAWCHTIPWLSAELLWIENLGINFSEIWNEIENFHWRKSIKSICKMSAILFWAQTQL